MEERLKYIADVSKEIKTKFINILVRVSSKLVHRCNTIRTLKFNKSQWE